MLLDHGFVKEFLTEFDSIKIEFNANKIFFENSKISEQKKKLIEEILKEEKKESKNKVCYMKKENPEISKRMRMVYRVLSFKSNMTPEIIKKLKEKKGISYENEIETINKIDFFFEDFLNSTFRSVLSFQSSLHDLSISRPRRFLFISQILQYNLLSQCISFVRLQSQKLTEWVNAFKMGEREVFEEGKKIIFS